MFNKNLVIKSLKRVVVLGIAFASISGIGAGVSNTVNTNANQVHASDWFNNPNTTKKLLRNSIMAGVKTDMENKDEFNTPGQRAYLKSEEQSVGLAKNNKGNKHIRKIGMNNIYHTIKVERRAIHHIHNKKAQRRDNRWLNSINRQANKLNHQIKRTKGKDNKSINKQLIHVEGRLTHFTKVVK